MDRIPLNIHVATSSTHLNSAECHRHRDDSSSTWTLPSIIKNGRARGCGLSDVSSEELQKWLEPVVDRLKQLDAEALLQLNRVKSGGARLRDG
jgi:hypothetical protein